MKIHRVLLAASAAVLLSVSSAFAGDPSGNWKWSLTTPNGDAIEISCVLEFKDGKLTGTYRSPFGEAKISNATFQDANVAFDVEREFDGNKFVVKYAGKLDGDAIKGTVTLPSWDGGEPQKSEWNATRAK